VTFRFQEGRSSPPARRLARFTTPGTAPIVTRVSGTQPERALEHARPKRETKIPADSPQLQAGSTSPQGAYRRKAGRNESTSKE
jgi:hypothetical protein